MAFSGTDSRRSPLERLLAWIVTGPLGHLYGVAADVTTSIVGEARRRSREGPRAVPGSDGPAPVRSAGTRARVCVIGAGSSGIAACQVLAARGVPFDCFEKGSGVGGNWRYGNDNGMSAAYRSLFINTSRRRMSYSTFPMPEDYPDYPHHTQIARYFDAYVDHFGLRDQISFRTEVTAVEPTSDGDGWEVTTDDGSTRRYDAVLVANGHHWDPRWPDFPGEFAGEEIHAHAYDGPEGFEDRNVLVLGIGNSACDIACETSRVSRMTYLAMRRGAYVIPKYIGGKPTDELSTDFTTRLPFPVQRALSAFMLKQVQGDMEDYGLPKPDHKLMEAHPTVSAELLARIGHGRIKPKPNIERLEGDRVRFADGSVEAIDRIVYCTGYKITFPFLSQDVVSTKDNRVPLYRRVVHPDRPGLFFIGLLQPLGAIMPLAEAQAEWVADLLEGRASLPSRQEMRQVIEREDRRMAKRYVASKRHTIQVDFFPYLRTLRRERQRGRGRFLRGRLARRSHELRVESPA
jgi:cation diffusion facilitator CzcD-associated flavoprotein CzcO